MAYCQFGQRQLWEGQLPCTREGDFHGYCFWHRPGKRHFEVLTPQLESLLQENMDVQGLNLAQSDLSGLVAYNPQLKNAPPDLTGSNFKRAILKDTHFFHCNLSKCNFIKADLRGANLNHANLEDSNLLGVRLEGAHLEHVNWGQMVLQEKNARQAMALSHKKEAQEWFSEAEEVYRNLRTEFEKRGLFETSARFFYREMIVRRYQMPFWSIQRFSSKVNDLISGYSEKPMRVILSSLVVIYFYALTYFVFGLKEGERKLGVFYAHDWQSLILDFSECLYFSSVSFSTKGYGLLQPLGWSRAFAVSEAFVGAFWMALFVAVFVRKRSR